MFAEEKLELGFGEGGDRDWGWGHFGRRKKGLELLVGRGRSISWWNWGGLL